MASVRRLPSRAVARPNPLKVVVVDRDATQRRILTGLIDERGGGRFRATACANAAEARAAVQASPGAIVIADVETIGGATHLAEIDAPTIATSANGTLTTAIAAMRGGARDFLPKPIGAKALLDRLEEALSVELPAPAAELAESDADFAGFIGRSPPMIAVYEQIRRVAPSRAPVFLTGESGTGKELAAEAIHALGGAGRPFVAINCSAIPRELMESEMFGHVRGAFTGATENRLGAVELASGGTLFLDELTEMDAGLQSKLLRFVQDGRFRRVGGSETLHVDVRIISATNRDPHAEVGGGRLRTDLFHRLHVLPVHLPALRERGDDIRLLAEAFLARFGREEGRPVGGFTSDAIGALEAYAWPGNVRELANAVHRAVVLGDGSLLGAEVLPGEGRSNGPAAGFSTYASQERAIVERAVAARNGNIVQAARSLEISPSTIYRKMQAWRDPG